MEPWPKHPRIYEINTWVCLGELGVKHGAPVTLATVPTEEWDALGEFGFDAVWFMGVWERSPQGRAIAMADGKIMTACQNALPDMRDDAFVGSPYCVRRYVVDERLGGPDGLARAREELRRRGMRLMLDFVPNHVAPDHPWATEHPEYFIHGDAGEKERAPSAFVAVGDAVIACGRDPYFPAWPDVLQLNAFHPGLRQAAKDTLLDIARQADGVRCDMAMLFISSVFAKTWGEKAGAAPEAEYWREAIAAVKEAAPGFLFIAEAYWDMEWELQQQGFDASYDKRLYDRLAGDSAESVRLHLAADLAYQEKLVRFLENHDEPRARAAFPGAKGFAAAVTMATTPGVKLFHEGQIEGRAVQIPVFLARRPHEEAAAEVRDFYRALLAALQAPAWRGGEWRLCEREGWPDNTSHANIVAWTWRGADEHRLVVVNLSDAPAQARVRLPWDGLAGAAWTLSDCIGNDVFERDGDELAKLGLYVALPPWGYHVLGCRGAAKPVVENAP